MSKYIDVGWTGTPDAVIDGLASRGYVVNADQTVVLSDPSLAGSLVACTEYQVVDDVAFVLTRALAPIPLPPNVGMAGDQMIVRLAGVFFSAEPIAPDLNPIDLTFTGEYLWPYSTV